MIVGGDRPAERVRVVCPETGDANYLPADWAARVLGEAVPDARWWRDAPTAESSIGTARHFQLDRPAAAVDGGEA